MNSQLSILPTREKLKNLSNNTLQHSVCLGMNIQGMNPSLRRKNFYKIQAIMDEINYLKNINLIVPFIAIAESWLKEHITDSQINIFNYNVYRSDRKVSKNGGALVYIHKSILIDIYESFDDDICNAVACLSKNAKCIIICIYRPPNSRRTVF